MIKNNKRKWIEIKTDISDFLNSNQKKWFDSNYDEERYILTLSTN